MEQGAGQRRKQRAKEALGTLCRICDSQDLGVIPYADFRGFLNKVQIHLSEDLQKTLKERFSSSSGFQYKSALQVLDWSPQTSQWIVLLSDLPSVSPTSHRKSQPPSALRLM